MEQAYKKEEENIFLFEDDKSKILSSLKFYEDKLINLTKANRNIWTTKSSYKNFSIFKIKPEQKEKINSFLEGDLTSLKVNLEMIYDDKIAISEEENRRESFLDFDKISRDDKKIVKELGINALYFVPYYLLTSLEDKEDENKIVPIRSPIFLIPIKLNCQKGKESVLMEFDNERSIVVNSFILNFVLKIDDTTEIDYTTNKSIKENLQKIFNNEQIKRKELSQQILDFLEGFDDEIIPFANQSSLKKIDTKIEKSFTIGFFNKYDNSLREDVIKIREQEKINKNLRYINDSKTYYDLKDLSFSEYYDKRKNENKESNIYYVDNLNYEQLLALKKINREDINNLVVWGPPGTGKSQLIVSLIYDAILKNKKVALISEKKAALDVIYKRLESLQAFIFYLSDINDKKAFYDNLQNSINEITQPYKESKNKKLDENDFYLLNVNISRYLSELDKIDYRNKLSNLDNKSFQELINEYYEIFSKGLNFQDESINNLNKSLSDDIKEYILNTDLSSMLKSLFTIRNFSDNYYENVNDYFNSYDKLTTEYSEYSLNVNLFKEDFFERKKEINTSISSEQEAIKQLENENVSSGKQIDKNIGFNDEVILLKQELKESLELKILKTRANLEAFEDKVKNLSAKIEIDEFSDWREKITNLNKTFTSFKNNFNEYLRLPLLKKWWKHFVLKKHIKENLNTLINVHKLKISGNFEKMNFEDFREIQKQCIKLEWRYHLKYFKDEIERMSSILAKRNIELNQSIEANNNEIFQKKNLIDVYDKKIVRINEEEIEVSAYFEDLEKVNELSNFELKIYREYLYSNSKSKTNIKKIQKQIEDFKKFVIFYKLKNSPEYNELTLNCKNWNENYKLLSDNINGKIDLSKNLSLQTLTKNFKTHFDNNQKAKIISRINSKRKHSIPKFLKNHYDQFKNMYQIWLMRPETFSSIFDITEKFDLIIFDEASQIFFERSIPAVQRGKKIVVLGDEKQLKPTDFFMSTFSDEEHGEEIDDDIDKNISLLDFAKSNFPKIMLKNHYRSDFKELIEFSKEKFYNNELEIITKKSAFISDINYKPIDYIYLEDSIYENSYNKLEIEKVIEVLQQIKNDPKFKGKTVGIITINSTQEKFLEDKIQRISFSDDDFASWCKDSDLFVKSIENVQGDERDIIVFSTVYGKDLKGKQSHNFGPINRKFGGVNRLNVAITRSKIKMIVISSINLNKLSDFINRNSYHKDNQESGMVIFYEFLKYATKSSKIGIDIISKTKFDSPFEEDVYETLKGQIKKKYNLDIAVHHKVFGSEIDFLVFDPSTKKPILAIEADGAMYNSHKPARLRDLSKQVFFETRGYDFYRIWSTNWFLKRGKETEVRKIFELLDQIVKK